MQQIAEFYKVFIKWQYNLELDSGSSYRTDDVTDHKMMVSVKSSSHHESRHIRESVFQSNNGMMRLIKCFYYISVSNINK